MKANPRQFLDLSQLFVASTRDCCVFNSSPGWEYHELPAVETTSLILPPSWEEQNCFLVVTTRSFVGGGRLRAEVEETMTEEEEWGRVIGGPGGGGMVMFPVSLSHQAFPLWVNPKMYNFQTPSTLLSSATAFPASLSTPCKCSLLMLLGSADECSRMGPGHQDSQTHTFSYNLCAGAASALRNILLLCLQLHSIDLHPKPFSKEWL